MLRTSPAITRGNHRPLPIPNPNKSFPRIGAIIISPFLTFFAHLLTSLSTSPETTGNPDTITDFKVESRLTDFSTNFRHYSTRFVGAGDGECGRVFAITDLKVGVAIGVSHHITSQKRTQQRNYGHRSYNQTSRPRLSVCPLPFSHQSDAALICINNKSSPGSGIGTSLSS